MSEHEGGDSRWVGPFVLGFALGVLVCLGVGGSFVAVMSAQVAREREQAVRAAEEARRAAEQAREEAEQERARARKGVE